MEMFYFGKIKFMVLFMLFFIKYDIAFITNIQSHYKNGIL